MRILLVTLGWKDCWQEEKFQDLKHQALQSCCAHGVDASSVVACTSWYSYPDLLVTDAQYVNLSMDGLWFRETKTTITAQTQVESTLGTLLNQLAEKLERVEQAMDFCSAPRRMPGMPADVEHDYYNQVVGAHLSGNALSLYNELMLASDCCTDELQTRLDEGWRIIAACPQPQRRPDYILGRINPSRSPVPAYRDAQRSTRV